MSQHCPSLYIHAPLDWQQQSAQPDQDSWQEINDANTRLLQLYYVLEDRRGESIGDESETQKPEMQRLEAKVDYLIELVTSMAEQQKRLPEPLDITLNSETISWPSSEAPPEVGSLLKVNLFILPLVSRPLQLFTTIQATSVHLISGTLLDRTASCYQMLDRIVFRYHRREIARNKKR